MGWYFIASPSEQIMSLLTQVGTFPTEILSPEPEPVRGISFYTEDLDAVLSILGLDDREVNEVSSGIEGVNRLVFGNKRSKPRAALKPRHKPKEGADAFASSYLDVLQLSGERLVADQEQMVAEVNRLTKELSTASANLEQLEFRLLAAHTIDEEVTALLVKEYEAIRSDPRVDRLATTEDLLMLQTKDVVIEKDQNRYQIGRLRITLGLLDGSVKVEPVEQAFGPTAHPLISASGLLYLGPLRDALVRYIGRREFSSASKLLLDLLTAAPRENAVARPLDEWPKVPAAS